MTLRDLKNEVYSLCFISPDENEGLFLSSARRALFMIFSRLGLVAEKRIFKKTLPVLSRYKGLTHQGYETKTLPLAGRAYSMKLAGRGSVIIRDGALVTRKDFNGEEVVFRDFIKYGGEISLVGDYRFTLVEFICYADSFSNDPKDIPECGGWVVDMSRSPDFSSFVSVCEEGGAEIEGWRTEGARLILPEGCPECIRVTYRKRPLQVSSDEDEIDIPCRLSALVSPLCSALMLCDDNPELSEKYMKLYESMVSEISLSQKNADQKRVRTNGWA